jgi:hypothetical protein
MNLSAPSEAAGLINGNALITYCDAPSPSPFSAACVAYATAIADVFMGGESIEGFSACIPLNVNARQLADIVRSYLYRNPSLRHHRASGLVAAAFQEAFPCQN